MHKEMESKKDEKADDAKEEENEQNEETEEIELKKKRRRNKDKAKGVDTGGAQQSARKSVDNAEPTLKCGKCNEVFKSKNALFVHLKKFPAHALLKEVAQADASKKGKKKGKR